MRKGGDPKRLGLLVEIERVRRVAAEACLIDARRDERQASDVHDASVETRRNAEHCWIDYLSAPGFAPERARAVAAQLLASDTAAGQTGEALNRRRVAVEQRDEAWRCAEAQVRSIERSHASAHRVASRRLEERRLADLEDRTMRKWGAA